MNQYNDLIIKCPNPEHANNVKLVCFDESCKADRLYCMHCSRNGIHFSHPQYQYQLSNLFDHIEKIEKECDDLINRLNKQMDFVYQSFYLLIGGIKTKYQISKEQIFNLNSKQINSILAETIQFKSFRSTIEILIQKYSNELQDQIQKLFQDLNLNQLNYYQVSDQDIKKSEELYQKGYKLYWYDHKYEEAIAILDQALRLNSKHQLALWCKAESLKMLDQYNEAIIWADKALQVDPKHFNSLYTKAESLRMLDQYNEAIIWVDKALQIDSKHCNSLFTKASSLRGLGQYNDAIVWADKALQIDSKHCNSLSTKSVSLRMLKSYEEAIAVIDQSLQVNPNHLDSLWSKGKLLQDQNQYQEALMCYDKALKIKENHQWTKDRKNECLDAIKKK
ncbi:unnamed protein product (macronuclear) [Paramecium tetraurelia]|uniref:Uncharacterized protein n=1 Tax=Paramecium tetraurelia TaxID=5888 RepID=A0BKV5_PARTE|nr:uncharacterized protein GSPATT00029803001 [Paramecium tetraurelia]CAK59172.1 unnamed protein product [Paramecium tetraurelia]|eukprot:XP_001426570.1 hypothetical protein (macronuclear) [Paramecium tetraurelia strain d4-2]